MPIKGGRSIQLDWAERTNPNRSVRSEVISLLPQKIEHRRQGGGGFAGGESRLRQNLSMRIADGTNEFGAAGFDASKYPRIHFAHVGPNGKRGRRCSPNS